MTAQAGASTLQSVAFLGPSASYTHQAALTHFPEATAYSLDPQVTIEDVFSAVQSQRARYGVVPFENSSNGSVVFTLDLFADRDGRYSDLVVIGEVYVPVRHCLLGRRSPNERAASPTAHITKLYSHPQAWGQCNNFLHTHLKGIERQDVSSTSRAAELVAADAAPNTAAISSKIAAEVNGLDVLVEGIEDYAGNATRFFVLQHRSHPVEIASPPAGSVASQSELARTARSYKSLVTFTVAHTAPGALADCLAVFKRHGLNLTSINTRPAGGANPAWQYIFFVEFRGRRGDGTGVGAEMEAALRELDSVASACRWLGSWEDALPHER